MSSRIVESEVVTIRKEAVSPSINISWNPQDNSGQIEFWVKHEVSENGTFVRYEPDTRPTMQPLRRSLENILSRVIMVPNPQGGDPIPVPATLVMGAVKQVFDDIYTEEVITLELVANMEAAQETPTEVTVEVPSEASAPVSIEPPEDYV